MRYKFKWMIYTILLIFAIALNFEQIIVERWMLLSLKNSQIVVSFTTTPHRINEMQTTVATILQQTAPIQAIYLSVPYIFKRDNIKYKIPEWLQQEKKITILRSKDYGPATKLLGLLEQITLEPNTIIITLDDDIKYPPNTVLQLAYKALKNPKKVIAICGSDPEYDLNGKIAASSRNGIKKNIRPNTQVTIAQGFAGIAYRPEFFDDTIFNIIHGPQECINSDDVYISFYLAQRHVPREILNNRYIGFAKIDWDNQLSLSDNALHRLMPGPRDKHEKCISYLKSIDPATKF